MFGVEGFLQCCLEGPTQAWCVEDSTMDYTGGSFDSSKEDH